MKTFDAAAWAVAVSLILFFALALPAFAQVAPPSRGGTGTSTLPTLGQLLMGQANGTYGPQSTSTLGLLTTNVAEGTNQYFTEARARSAVSSGYATAAIPFGDGTKFTVDGTKLVWDSPTSRLGVNVESPSATLTVGGSVSLTNGADRSISLGSATNYFYSLRSSGDDFQILEAGSLPRLHIEYPNGYVGIGTTTPAGQLDVATGLNGYAFIGGNTSLAHRGVKIGQNSDGYAVIQGFARGSDNAFDLTLQPEGGNVGIGATTPNSALHISRALPIIHYDRSGSYSWYQGQTDGSGYSGGTSDFGIWDNSGTSRFIISASTGNVGIGNTTPSYRLTVVDLETDGVAGRFAQGGTGSPFGVYSTATGAGTTNTSGYFQASGATRNIGVSADVPSGSNNYAFYAGNTAKSYFAGNVGIGTDSPGYLLTVRNDNNDSNPRLGITNLSSGASARASVQFINDAAGTAFIGVNGSGTGPGIGFPDALLTQSDKDAGIAFVAASANGITRFFTGGTSSSNERMRITAVGSVGVGITNPTSLLHLYSAATTTLTVDSSAADKGSCLKLKDSDGSGFTYVTANDGVLTASSISCE